VSERPPLPEAFAWRYLRAVYHAGAPMEASRLAAVYVNVAYAQQPRSTVVDAGEPLLRDGAGFRHGRSFDRAIQWLTEHGFLELVEVGRGRRPSTWALLAPAQGRELEAHLTSVLARALDDAEAEGVSS
jgi:hypothetical protein